MTHYIRIENGEVKDVWDTPPAEGVGNNGWVNAIEIRHPSNPDRQGYHAHRYDLTTDPVQIIWDTYDFTVDERKGTMRMNAQTDFITELNLQKFDAMAYDPAKLLALKEAIAPRIAAIDAATTHEELDALL
jgi:hypothetical protein